MKLIISGQNALSGRGHGGKVSTPSSWFIIPHKTLSGLSLESVVFTYESPGGNNSLLNPSNNWSLIFTDTDSKIDSGVLWAWIMIWPAWRLKKCTSVKTDFLS